MAHRAGHILEDFQLRDLGTSGLATRAIRQANLPTLAGSLAESRATLREQERIRQAGFLGRIAQQRTGLLEDLRKPRPRGLRPFTGGVQPIGGRRRGRGGQTGGADAQFILTQTQVPSTKAGVSPSPGFQLRSRSGGQQNFTSLKELKDFLRQNPEVASVVAGAPGLLPGARARTVLGGAGALSPAIAKELNLQQLTRQQATTITGRGVSIGGITSFLNNLAPPGRFDAQGKEITKESEKRKSIKKQNEQLRREIRNRRERESIRASAARRRTRNFPNFGNITLS